MNQIETFHRGDELGRQPSLMPASSYNEMYTLFHRSEKSCLFVPIRLMQYMAVIDHEEVIFVDSMKKALVEFSWKNFHPQSREKLTDVVPYEFVYYDLKALETIKRVQMEFSKCIHQMMGREQLKLGGSQLDVIIPFDRNNK